ncbi:amidohydrolase [Nocardioides dongxiaopingii]|uniref:amidohydrolase n=1 Tax=Nocardioides sp. S-1144 TaxID=2582905 RepID=UPI0011647CAD|nr:amidohydrolase [Nocardioides sp. S-1144]QDH11025.1 amidohydrolase [Nocardioides sp. S-1144]
MTTLLRNAALFDGRRYRGPGHEVLLDAGRVVAVGAAGASGAAGLGSRARAGVDDVVDVGGALLAPGFVDAHVHPVQGGLERMRCDLSELDTREEYVAAVAAHAAANPDAPWILGGGWAMPAFPGGTPTAADLDAVVPDRPVFLPNRDHHGAWVNSRALEVAGIDRHTPDPADGRIERDAGGRPTGTLHEGATSLVSRHLPPTTDADQLAALLTGQAHLHSLGVTGWQDAIVGAYSGMDDTSATYTAAAASGDLRSDVVGALWWDRERGVEQVAELVARREAMSGGRFHATSVKIMQDGVAENGTAALDAPYLDRCGHATDNTGHSFLSAAELRAAVTALDTAGFQVHVHAIGDRGVREALDAFEGTDPATRAERRHHLAHLQVVHPDDVRRFAALDVAANAQALWACLDEQMVDLTLPFLGEERARWQYPFGDLHRAGARLVAGSDWPVSTPDPLQAIHVAVNRWAHGQDGQDGPAGPGGEPVAFLPEQALTLEAAFAAYTSGSAWINHRDRRDGAGVVAPGAAADLVVLDRDPFAAPAAEIGAARVVSTWIDGEVVHQQRNR